MPVGEIKVFIEVLLSIVLYSLNMAPPIGTWLATSIHRLLLGVYS